MDLIYDRIVGSRYGFEGAYEIMVFRGNRVEEFWRKLLANNGDLPTLGLYDESNCYVPSGARYRGDISVSLTRSGNTRVRQYLGINC